MIVQHRRRDDLLVRVLFLLRFDRRVHIDHQLKLQTIIERRQIKLPAAGFVVDHLHVDLVPALTGVDPVDPAAQVHLFLLAQRNIQRIQILQHGEGHLELLRHESAFLKLFLERSHRPVQDPHDPLQQMPVPRAAVQDRMTVADRILFQRLVDHRRRVLLREIKPGIPPLAQPAGKDFQHAVKNISHIHIFKGKFAPLLQRKPILQKVRVGARCIALQPAHAVLQHASIERPCDQR